MLGSQQQSDNYSTRMNQQKSQKVHVVDDDPNDLILICRYLEDLGIETRGYSSAHHFFSDPHSRSCACLVLDVRMPNVSGLELQKILIAEGWPGATIFLTDLNDAPSAVCAVKELQAEDYVLKPMSPSGMKEFQDSVLAVLEKQHSVQQDAQHRLSTEEHLVNLSPREKEILNLIMQGLLNKQIADQLQISTRTVEFHRANIMRRLGVSSAANLVRLVMEAGGRVIPAE